MEAPAALLLALDRLGMDIDADGDTIALTGATERLTGDMANQIRTLKPDLLARLRDRQARAARLLEQVEAATDWEALERPVACCIDAWSQGTLSRRQCERIGEAALVRGRQIPPHIPPDDTVLAWAAIEKDKKCYACGQIDWWMDKYGNRKCGTCHPQPESSVPWKPELIDALYGPKEEAT